jgi:hypothetical protein
MGSPHPFLAGFFTSGNRVRVCTTVKDRRKSGVEEDGSREGKGEGKGKGRASEGIGKGGEERGKGKGRGKGKD